MERYTLSTRILRVTGLLWLSLPVVMFSLWWLVPAVGIPLALAVCISVWLAVRGMHGGEERIPLDGKTWGVLVIVLFAVLISGIGGFSPQMEWDHAFRNAVFYDLVKYSWPVIDYSESEPRLLCYYFCFWLPAAGVAKITGSLLIGNICLVLYAFIGMGTVFLLFSKAVGKISVWLALLFFCFCSWDFIAYILTHEWKGFWAMFIAEKDPATTYFGAEAPIHSLFFAYNHGVPAWVGFTLMWYDRKRPEVLVLLLGMLAGFAPIPSVGVAPVVAYAVLRNFRRSLTFGNLTGFCCGLVFALFLTSNPFGGSPRLAFDSYTAPEYFFQLMVFFYCTYLPFFPFIWNEIKRDRLFIGLLACQLVLPLVQIGGTYDFGWRVGMAFMCYFMYKVFRRAARREARQKLFSAVVAVGVFSAAWIGYQWTFHIYLVAKDAPTYMVPGFQSSYRADWLGTSFNRVTQCYHNFVADNPDTFFTRHLLRTPLHLRA